MSKIKKEEGGCIGEKVEDQKERSDDWETEKNDSANTASKQDLKKNLYLGEKDTPNMLKKQKKKKERVQKGQSKLSPKMLLG